MENAKSGIIVPIGNQAMLDMVANGLKDLQDSGELAMLMQKYGLQAQWLIPIEIQP